MADLNLKVKGMSCHHCVSTIKENLNKLDGIDNVDVNLDSGEVDVFYNTEKIEVDKIKQTIQDSGYEVK